MDEILSMVLAVTFESVDEILGRGHSKDTFFAVLSHRVVLSLSANFLSVTIQKPIACSLKGY